MPALVHFCLVFIFGLESDGPTLMLLPAIGAPFVASLALFLKGYGPVESTVAGAYPGIVAAWNGWYWSFGFHAPVRPAQAFVSYLGWNGVTPTEAMSSLLLPAAAFGWFLGWYTNRPDRIMWRNPAKAGRRKK